MSDIAKKSFTPEEAEEQVRVMARLFGLMFYHFAETIVEKYGAAEGESLVREAVRHFGLNRGEDMRREAIRAGLDPNLRNFSRVSDLPKIGWGGETRETYCPLAQVWIEKNAEDLCKLYCAVDFWKMTGYNPEIKVKRLRWVLEGARDCKYEIK